MHSIANEFNQLQSVNLYCTCTYSCRLTCTPRVLLNSNSIHLNMYTYIVHKHAHVLSPYGS